MKILSIDDVSLAFGGLKVLSDVSFDVNEGEIFAKEIDMIYEG